MGEPEEKKMELETTGTENVAEAEGLRPETQQEPDKQLTGEFSEGDDIAMTDQLATDEAENDGAEIDDEGIEKTIDLEEKPEDCMLEDNGAGDDEKDVVAEHAAEEFQKDFQANGKPSVIEPIHRPPHGSEIFIGGIARETTEDDLKELCSPIAEIFEIRILKDKETGANKGYGFVTFMNKENAEKAIASLTDSEVKGKKVRVSHSQPKNRLFVGNLPKTWEKEELEKVLSQEGPGITSIELLKDPNVPARNRGFAFVEYYNHACAEQARRNLSKPQFRLGSNQATISWADPRPEPNAAAMSTVKVVYIKGLPDGTTEEHVKELFAKHGEITRIMLPAPKPGQPKRDFGFVHFAERSQALKAIENEKYELHGTALKVSLAKPPVEKRPSQESYTQSYRSGPLLSPYPQRAGGTGGGYGYVGGSPSQGGYERSTTAAAPGIYGRGPAPTGMTMAPIMQPYGRVAYSDPTSSGSGAGAPFYRDGAQGGRSGGSELYQSSPPARRYRPY